MSEPDGKLLEELRRRAFAIAYRMLGSVADAEDVVQEALLRVHRVLAAGERLESPLAYVATVTTRLAIDELRAARVRRKSYVGEWIPEPIVTDPAADPSRRAELAESLSLAFLVLLESLSPEQRAVLLLRDVFDYGYDEIAAVVGTSEANARQLAVRARRRALERRPRFEARPEARDALAERFFAAAEEGDLAALEALLAHDVVLRGDGGGKVPAITRPVHGRGAVARTLLAWTSEGLRAAGASLRRVEVNGQPGALVFDAGGKLIGVVALEVADGEVQGVMSIVNPDKLRHVAEVGDFRAFLQRRGRRHSAGGASPIQ